MTATVATLYHEFPLVFVLRLGISLLILLAFCGIAFMLYKRQKLNKLQFIVSIMLSAYVVLMLYFTVIGRYSWNIYRYDFDALAAYKRLFLTFDKQEIRQFLINVFMIVPIGSLTPLIISKKHKYILTLICCIALTLTIEFLQFFTRCGTFEVSDLINNMIGAVLGVMAYIIGRKIYNRVRKNYE